MSSASSEQKIKSGNISALSLNIISRPCEWIVYVSDCHSGHPRPPSCWSVSSPRKITSFNLLGIIYNWISEGQTPEGPWPDSHSSSPRDASLLRARVAPLIHFLLHFLGCVPRREKGVISSATSGILSLLLLPYFNSNMAALESKVLRVGYYALTVEPLTSCFPCSSKTVERKLFFFMSIHFCAWRSVTNNLALIINSCGIQYVCSSFYPGRLLYHGRSDTACFNKIRYIP